MVARYRSVAILIIFVVYQVAFLGVYDNCVKKTQPHPLSPQINIFKVLCTGFYIMHRIHNSQGIQIPPLGRSRHHCPPCLQTWGRRELPGNYPVFTVVMVIYHYVERIWRVLVTPIILYNIYYHE